MCANRCKKGTFQIPVDQWLSLTQERRAAIRFFCTAHPEVSGLQYLAGDYTKAQSTEAGREKQKELALRSAVKKYATAAKKYGVTVHHRKGFKPIHKMLSC